MTSHQRGIYKDRQIRKNKHRDRQTITTERHTDKNRQTHIREAYIQTQKYTKTNTGTGTDRQSLQTDIQIKTDRHTYATGRHTDITYRH